MTVHAEQRVTLEPAEPALDRLAAHLDQLMVRAEPIVALENVPRLAGTGVDAVTDLKAMVELKGRLPRPRFTLDVGHCPIAVMSARGSFEATRHPCAMFTSTTG